MNVTTVVVPVVFPNEAIMVWDVVQCTCALMYMSAHSPKYRCVSFFVNVIFVGPTCVMYVHACLLMHGKGFA